MKTTQVIAQRKIISPYATFGISSDRMAEIESALKFFSRHIGDQIQTPSDFDRVVCNAFSNADFEKIFTVDPSDPISTFSPKDDILFPDDLPLTNFTICSGKKGESTQIELFDVEMPDNETRLLIADSMRWIVGEQSDAPPWPEFIDYLEELGCFLEANLDEESIVPDYTKDGIYRLQHASLLYVSGDFSVLVDPVLHGLGCGDYNDPRIMLASLSCSAILISHSHGDHFSTASLCFFPKDILIIVPKVGRANLLCPSFFDQLTSMGFTNVIESKWHDDGIQVGPIRVFTLPFFGEQPRAHGYLRHPDLRNTGNTYLFETANDRTWVIVDSGDELGGRMVNVAEEVFDKFGPIDHIASNLREFTVFTPDYITGTGSYWACLKNEDIANFKSLSTEKITLGPIGVAEVLAAARCQKFIPYADWWAEVNSISSTELKLTERLIQALKTLNHSCAIVSVKVGQRVPLCNQFKNMN